MVGWPKNSIFIRKNDTQMTKIEDYETLRIKKKLCLSLSKRRV